MKKWYVLIFASIMMASCATSKNQEADEPVQTAPDTAPLAVEAPPEAPSEPETAAPPDVVDVIEETPPPVLVPPAPVAAEPEEPVLAEASIEEQPPAADSGPLVLDEPKAPVLAAPPPAPEPPPPPVAAAPVPAAPAPPPPTPAPTPPPPAPAPPPPASPAPEPAPAPTPPAPVPFSRDGPELPYPTPGITSFQDETIVFSRVVRATVGQLVEIPFRGTGWVYLGEAASRRGITYDSRRLDLEGQSFIFKTEAVGEYALKFFRQDFIRDFILNDYVQVIVGPPAETGATAWFNPPVDRGRVVAEPRWPSSLEEAQAIRADGRPQSPATSAVAPTAASPTGSPGTPDTSASPVAAAPSAAATAPSATPPTPAPAATGAPSATPPATTPSATPAAPAVTPSAAPAPAPESPAPENVGPPPISAESPLSGDIEYAPETYLEKAKEEFDAGRVASAIAILDQSRVYYPSGSDELWWLYGQFYEANTPSRNILTSLDCYRRLVEEYPQSSRYDDARRRIAYLQRYYINIH